MARASSGFTMVELMIVVAIAGILLALAAPSFTESMGRRRLEGVANELRSDLHFAKSQAASSNTSVSLVTTTSGYTISNSGTTFKQATLDSTVRVTNAATITFEPYRSFATASASITISQDRTAATLKVSTDAMGRIQLCSPGGTIQGYTTCP